jgi:hypothetical protein
MRTDGRSDIIGSICVHIVHMLQETLKTRLEMCNAYWNTQSSHMRSQHIYILNASS